MVVVLCACPEVCFGLVCGHGFDPRVAAKLARGSSHGSASRHVHRGRQAVQSVMWQPACHILGCGTCQRIVLFIGC
jgi:hypothetical protein